MFPERIISPKSHVLRPKYAHIRRRRAVSIFCSRTLGFVPEQETCCDHGGVRRGGVNSISRGKSTAHAEKGSDSKQSVFTLMFTPLPPFCLLS